MRCLGALWGSIQKATRCPHQGICDIGHEHPTYQFLASPTFEMRSQGNSKGACGCLCFVLKFTANIFIQSSASLSIGSCHLATLCWGGTEKETRAQFPPQGVLSQREKAPHPQGQSRSPGPAFRRNSALLASQLLASSALGGPRNPVAEGWGTEASWRMVPGE